MYCENQDHRPRKAKFEVALKNSEEKKMLCHKCTDKYIEAHIGLAYIRRMTWGEVKVVL